MVCRTTIAWLAPSVVVMLVCFPLASTAAGETMSERKTHGSIGVGGAVHITGSEGSSSNATLELYPGGRLGRLGVRASAHGFGRVAPNLFLAGLTFEAASARPRLTVALYGTVGANTDSNVAATVGVQTNLWLIGPLAIGLDTHALLVVDGTDDTELRLGSALTLRAGF